MNEKNILALKARLVQLGFEPSVETMLRCNICFMPSQFDLQTIKKVGNDHFCFSVHLERSEGNIYVPKYYTSTLQKQVTVPTELEKLDRVMQAIDWKVLTEGKVAHVQLSASEIQSAFDVLKELEAAGNSADILKYKYWIGTSLEPMIHQLSILKSEWEISERFYFFDETTAITFEDAVRFLSSKWMEKQMVVRRKLLVKRNVGDKSGAGVAGGKLLAKNPRRLSRRKVDKNL